MSIMKEKAKNQAVKSLVEKYQYTEFEARKVIEGIEIQLEGEFSRRLRLLAETHKAGKGVNA